MKLINPDLLISPDGDMGSWCGQCQKLVPLHEWMFFPSAFKKGAFLHRQCGFVKEVADAVEEG